jgi:carbonic anhydrase
MENMDSSKQKAAMDSSQVARDSAVPGFVTSSLIAGLPFLGLMMTVAILSNQEQIGRLVSLLVTLLVEGLCIAFFWRRIEPSSGKNFAIAAYAVGLWAFMGGCLVTTFGLRFGGMSDLARNVALLGSGVVALSGFFFAIVWAQSQAPRLMVQTHTMIATSVVLAGFAALVLKGSTPSSDSHGETLSAHSNQSMEKVHGDAAPDAHGSRLDHPPTNHSREHDSGRHDTTHTSPSHDPNSHSPDMNDDSHDGRGEKPRASQNSHDGTDHRGNSHDAGSHQEATNPKAHGSDSHHANHEDHGSSDDHRDRRDDEEHHADGSHQPTHEWSYEGTTGPETWGKIKPEWKTCLNGKEQSPIEIAKGSKESRRIISLSYEENKATLVSNGELLQVILGRGSQAIINGKAYELTRLDFHSPSEHEISGVSYPMEIQFVHKDGKGRMAIISAFVEKGPPHNEIGKILSHFPPKPGAPKSLKTPLQLGSILPREATALSYQYKGSLTTPPCSEGILWSVLKTPLRMGESQIAAFRAQFAGSNRPVQPLGKRHIGPIEGSISH